MHVVNSQALRWNFKDIDFKAIDRKLISDDQFLFYMLASASMVEILAHTYTDNLVEHFKDHEDVVLWLREHWQQEETQHGVALKAYVQEVWPEFDWDAANQNFQAEYRQLCDAEHLEPDRALELVARCVVETGTTTLYQAALHYANEPVLKELLNNIRMDEANHYVRFRRYYQEFEKNEQPKVWRIVNAIFRRMKVIQGEDSYIAFKHVYATRHPHHAFRDAYWVDFSASVKRHARHHYPYTVAVRMILKLLPEKSLLQRVLRWPLLGAANILSKQ